MLHKHCGLETKRSAISPVYLYISSFEPIDSGAFRKKDQECRLVFPTHTPTHLPLLLVHFFNLHLKLSFQVNVYHTRRKYENVRSRQMH